MFNIADQTLFVQRVVNARRRGVVFLVGSGLVAPMSADQPGVPAVDGMVDLIRARYRGQAEQLAAFERYLEAAQTHRYQAAFQYLQRTHGQDEVNRVIREGVLKARRKELAGETVQEGDLTAYAALEQDVNGWFISPALEEFGRIVTQFPDEYGRYVLTTNFDPLIEVAIRRAGASPTSSALQSDGGFVNIEAPGCHVVHLHGYWRRGDTLHTPTQLLQDRPLLASSLRRVLREHVLVSLAYSGWDDVLTRALLQIVQEDESRFDIVWGFYEKEPEAITARYGRLIENLRKGEVRGRVSYYGGVDVNQVFPALWKELSTTVVPAREPAPLTSWERGGDEQEWLNDLVSPDPLVSLQAAKHLSKRPDLIPQVLACRESDLVPVSSIRLVLAANPAQAAPLAIEIIESEGWYDASHVARCLSPPLAPYASDQLAKSINIGVIDRTRAVVLALGRLAAEEWAFMIAKLLKAGSSYYTEKYSIYVIEALVDIFAHSRPSAFGFDRVSDSANYLREAILIGIEAWGRLEALWGYSDQLVLRQCGGAHADVLISEWLTSSHRAIRLIAAGTLGDIRIARAVPPLHSLLAHEEDSFVINQTARALATIRTEEAVGALVEGERSRSWVGLTLCVDILPDPVLRDQLIEELLAGSDRMRWTALRAVGRLGETSQVPMLRKELFGRDPLERGVAALALAHLEGGKRAFNLLQRAWRDGASALERIFSALAMLKVDPESWGQVERQLRADLAAYSPYLLFFPLQLDIIETLRSAGHEGASSLAEAWEPFFYRLD